jgi:DNA polymerase III delta prime subunit
MWNMVVTLPHMWEMLSYQQFLPHSTSLYRTDLCWTMNPFMLWQVPDSACHLLSVNVTLQYESYFRHHIAAEIDAQRSRNDDYALYEHDVAIRFLPNGDMECAMVVPGLREDSPHIEEGDVIELRQFMYPAPPQNPLQILWYSRPGKPLNTTLYHMHFPLNSEYSKGEWTGKVLFARVSNVLRKEEKLLLVIDKVGFPLLMTDVANTVGQIVHGKFNVQFPTMEERYFGMRSVLPVIQNVLQSTTTQHLTDFGAVLGPSSKHGSPTVNTSTRAWLSSTLYPLNDDCAVQSSLNSRLFSRRYFDTQLNREQQKAVESACLQDYGSVPFLISGPPGTGKTKTLVEIALQLVHNVEGVCHILFCAPSDPAADTLVQRLSSHCKQGELLRLNRITRTFAEVPGTVLPYCSIDQNAFTLPSFAQLMRYKIVVTTTRDAAMLMYARLTNTDLYFAECGQRSVIHPYRRPSSVIDLHWSALLIDEAAQAIEPEALIPLSIVAPPSGVANLAFKPLFIMAGDEYQLGPRLALLDSPLKTSLFARLFARKVYSEHPLARGKTGKAPPALEHGMLPILRPPFTNLIANYRSHPAILAIPSNLFYNDTLENHALDISRLSSWEGWKGRKWPVLFYNSSGEAEDDLEQDGGGWYNFKEARIACDFAKSIMATQAVQPEEICIMSTFKAQINCLRKIARQDEYSMLRGVDIGPTEVFQGLERGVVILCTTRTKERFISRDQEQGWGIIGTHNKLNVALTRAKFGLIVIGKIEALESDENWRAFMSFCARNDLWDGKAHAWSKGGELNRLEKVMLNKEHEEVERRSRKALKVWDRGHSGISDDAMWANGVQAEEDDMGSSEGEDDFEDEEPTNSTTRIRGEQDLFEADDNDDHDGAFIMNDLQRSL